MEANPGGGMNDIVERLRKAGVYLGNAIAGYRDNDNKRAARGTVDAGRAMLEAADEIERLRAANTGIVEFPADAANLRDMLNGCRNALNSRTVELVKAEAEIERLRAMRRTENGTGGNPHQQ